MLSAIIPLFTWRVIALTLGLVTASASAKNYDWPLPENASLTVNIPRGALLILTRTDGKPLVSLDLQKIHIVRDSSLKTRQITGDIPSEEPLWTQQGTTATLNLPAPADIDLQKVKGVTAALVLPATGEYEINAGLSDVYLKDTKNTLRIKAVNGKVLAQNASAGNVSIDVLNGSITTEGMKGNLSLKLRGGTITDKGSQGEMNIDLINGDVLLNSSAKTLHIKQITGNQTIDAQACEVFTNDLQTGSSTIRLGSGLKKGEIVSAGGEIVTLIADDWQGNIIAEGISGNNIINHLSDMKPIATKPLLTDERLELTQGSKPYARLTLSTVGGVLTLQHPQQAGK